jgi:DNA-binding IclR family transcriptional regulator
VSSVVKSAERVLTILDFLSSRPAPVPSMVIARHCELPRSSAYHLLNVLRERGYVRYYERDRRWGLGSAVVPIASAYERTRPVRMLARPVLADLARATQASCSVRRLEGATLVRVADADPPRRRKPAEAGGDVPVYACAAGRVLLADLPDAQLAAVLPPGSDALPWPGERPIPLAALRSRLQTERAAGRAVDPVGELLGADVAVPVREGSRAVLALGLALTPDRPAPSRRDLEALDAAAERLGEALRAPAQCQAPGLDAVGA